MYKKSLGMRHFGDLLSKAKAECPILGWQSSVEMKKNEMKEKGSHGEGRMCNRCWPGWQNGDSWFHRISLERGRYTLIPAPLRSTSVQFWLGVCLALVSVGCQSFQQRGAKGSGLLPKPAGDEKRFSSFQPTNPYTPMASGLLSRRVFETTGPPGMHIEVLDLLVGPGKRVESARLTGTQVCEVRAGHGILIMDSQRQEMKPGFTFAIPDGKSFTLENTTTEAIQIRAYTIRPE